MTDEELEAMKPTLQLLFSSQLPGQWDYHRAIGTGVDKMLQICACCQRPSERGVDVCPDIYNCKCEPHLWKRWIRETFFEE